MSRRVATEDLTVTNISWATDPAAIPAPSPICTPGDDQHILANPNVIAYHHIAFSTKLSGFLGTVYNISKRPR